MKLPITSLLVYIVPLFISSGCATHRFATVYTSSVKSAEYDRIVSTQDSTLLAIISSLDQNIQYEVVGMGYGESIGSTVKEPDFIEAYKMAVESKNGDFLINTNYQIISNGPRLTLKVWGLVIKLNK
jgi:hypothetical protein